jgi:cytochrome c-type biogenesis protein CcmH
MRNLRQFAIGLVFTIISAMAIIPATAVNPDEVLKDPVLEARARDLSTHLRCLVCQNQSIDDSDADLARDLRLLVRERLTAGDSDIQVLDYLVARYGEFVLLQPRVSAKTYLLWGTPIFLLMLGGIVLVISQRKRAKAKSNTLSSTEKAALAKILSDRD